MSRTRATAPRGPVCSECGAGVFRHLLVDADRAARVVISATPDRYGAGRVAAYRDVAGGWHARLLEHGQAPRWGERRYRPHIEECKTLAGQRTA